MQLSAFILNVMPRLEHDARMARATTRAIEQETGMATDDHGRYWLQRTAALETVAEHARRVLHLFDDSAYYPQMCAGMEDLEAALQVLDEIKAPACNDADHGPKGGEGQEKQRFDIARQSAFLSPRAENETRE